MSIRNLDKLFKPRSVALIGATEREGSVGAVVLRNLRRAGFHGELLPVNRLHQSLGGMPVCPEVASLPRPPDLAVIVSPPDTVPDLVAALAASGTKAAVVLTPGFGELGDSGRTLQYATLEAARPYLMRLLGPNSVGIMAPQIGLDASFSHLAPPAGDIAFVSQSGAMITAMLDYLAADPATRAILLYAEDITHGRKFMSAARAAARSKPVLVLKAGHSAAGAQAAASHTGMLAGKDAIYDAAFRRAGILRVGHMAELFDAAETLALTRPQTGDRLVILTNSGGAGVLATDALEAAGGHLAALTPETIELLDRVLPPAWSRANPIDITGDSSGEHYAAALTALFADRGINAFLILNGPTALAEPEEAARAVIDVSATASRDRLRDRNIFTAWPWGIFGRDGAPPLQRGADPDLRHAGDGGSRLPSPRRLSAQPGIADGDPAGAPRSVRTRCRGGPNHHHHERAARWPILARRRGGGFRARRLRHSAAARPQSGRCRRSGRCRCRNRLSGCAQNPLA
jgi:acetyltransferase